MADPVGTRIHYPPAVIPAGFRDATVAVVGYGNQGRSWALNLRDSGFAVRVCVRADETRRAATEDGFPVGEIADADSADVICILVPDDVIPALGIRPSDRALCVVASGYTLAFDRFTPTRGDLVMIAPRMLGPEVRSCYTEGVGFITAVGVHEDRSGEATQRMLAIADAIGGLSQGAIEMTPRDEAVLDLAVEQLLSPALTYVNTVFVTALLEQGIALEAIMTELVLSGEIERNYRRLREEGFVGQLDHHSPTSQYGQLSRRGRYDHLDLATVMRDSLDEIASGRFADEWDSERDASHTTLAALREEHAGAGIADLEADMRRRLGEFRDR